MMEDENILMGGISLGGTGNGNQNGADNSGKGQEQGSSGALQIIIKRPNTSVTMSSSDNTESFEERIKLCPSESSMFFLLSKRLQCHRDMRVGDPKLYSSLFDAAKYIQILCENNKDSQDRLRISGVLGTLVDTFIVIFKTHLEDRVSPLSYAPLMKCWCQISSALWHSVDNPTNARNQETVLVKLLSNSDLKIIDFVLKSSHSIEKQTEAYVIPIIQLFKGLIDDNLKNQEMLSSRKEFVVYLIESFRLRVQQKQLDALMWKSADLMAWLLSLILQYENSTLAKQEDSDSQIAAKRDIDTKLCGLVGPCCSFLDTNENDERSQSVGTLLFLASVFSRNIESVHRFNNCRGNDLIVKMHGADHPEPVKDAMRALMTILKFQNKLLRQDSTSRGQHVMDERSSCSIHTQNGCLLPYSYTGPISSDFCKSSTAVDDSSRTPSPPFQVVPGWIDEDKESMCKAWVDYATTVTLGNKRMGFTPSMDSLNYPSPAPPPPSSAASESRFSSSISKYRQPSVLGNPPPPRFQTANSTWCAGKSSSGFRPPHKKRRLTSETTKFETRRTERRPRDYDDDRSSLFSIAIPKVPAQNTNDRTRAETTELSSSDVAQILSDLRPCKVMETNDHLVVFCTPGSQTNGSSNKEEIGPKKSTPRSSKPPDKCSLKSSPQASTSLLGSVFNWLFK